MAAEIGIACFGVVATKVTEWVVVPIGRQVGFAFNYESNFADLKEQVEKLKHRRERVQHAVDDARRQVHEIEKDVENWLIRVDELIGRVDRFIVEDEEKGKKRCFKGLCPNPVMRYFLNKKAVATKEECVRGWGEGEFDRVSYCPVLVTSDSFYVRGYEVFETRTRVLDAIMGALNDDNINRIGVYGMGGVGKTTLAKKVAWQAKQDKLFDVVVMVEIKQNPDHKAIQEQIASQLGLELQKGSESSRAARLREKLKREKRVLLILDDIWVKIDLEAIGIPFQGNKKGSGTQQVDVDHGGRDDNKGPCRILMTSRSLHVLRNDMNTQKDFLITTLAEEEAKKLFWKIAGGAAEDFKSIAVEVVSKCDDLPIAIETIASALKHKSLPVWKDALQQLRMSKTKNTIPGMEENVYSLIKLSYDFLGSEEAKSLFLLCGLYIDNVQWIYVSDLFKYGMGLGLFEEVYTLEDGRNRLYTLISNLIESCLLMYLENGFIGMHDVIHAVAISLASTNELMYNIRDAAGLKKRLEDLPKDLKALSLPFINFDELPERLEFPKLKFLYLHAKGETLQITNAFFEDVKELRVLDITGMHLPSVPLSICRLTNLQTLCLDNCTLGNIATVGGLKKLEILSFLHSSIRELPGEIRQLTQLKLLDLSNCSSLEVIAPNVLSSLTQLEELYMGNTFVRWEAEGNGSLAELKQLSHLTLLEIYVHNAQNMPKDLSFEKLDKFKIVIGNVWSRLHRHENSRTLKLKLNDHSYLSQGVKSLLKKTEDLYLDEMQGVKNVLYELDNDGFRQLKHLHIQNTLEILYIVNSWNSAHCISSFPNLESLILHNLINLGKVCHGKITTESFSKLKIMKVEKCNKLKYLISVSMLRRLLNLQELEVIDCENLKEIVSKESEDHVQENEGSKIELPHLRSLSLQCLPQLLCFGSNVNMPSISQSSSPTDMGSQEIVVEDGLLNLSPLFSHNVVLPSLEKLTLSSINIECRWLNQFPVISSSCQTLTRLIVEECSGPKFLFSYSVVECMAQLQELKIRNCRSMEGIIDTEELRQGNTMKMAFHKLHRLQLKGLPNLTRFGSGCSVEFSSLITVEIKDCPNLKTFFSDSVVAEVSKEQEEINLEHCGAGVRSFFDVKVKLPTLTSLRLSSTGIQTIWHNQLQAVSSCLQNLTELTVENCDNLKYVLSSSMIESFVQLMFLKISNCKSMVRVIDGDEVRIDNTFFPKLYQLTLKDLPQLKTFCCFAGDNSVQLPSLDELEITHCPKMQTFASDSCADMTAMEEHEEVNTKENLHSFFHEKVKLPTLTSLRLSSTDIQTIWHNQLEAVSSCFQNLTKLTVENCDNLKYLLSSSMIESFDQLDFLVISNCKSMVRVIDGDDVRIGNTFFPKLNRLILKDLPQLKTFCCFAGENSVQLPSLTELEITHCPKMQTIASDSCADMTAMEEHEEVNTKENLHSFFHEKVKLPTLTSLRLSSTDIQTIWHNQLQAVSSCFQNLTKLTVENCDNLKYLLSSSMIESFVQLDFLVISNCKSMVRVIDGDEVQIVNTFFPKLHRLILKDLPQLKTFCCFAGDNSVQLPSLTELEITHCPKMQTFTSNSCADNTTMEEPEEVNTKENLHSFFHEKVKLPTLASLSLSSTGIQTTWNNQLQAMSSCLQNLMELTVENCDNLKYVLSSSMIESFVQLMFLKISNCKSMVRVIDGDEVRIGNTFFPKLYQLTLKDLPQLETFCCFAGDNSVQLPSLDELEITHCPKMQTFASDSCVDMTTMEEPEEVNTKEHLHSFFHEKVAFPCLTELRLSQPPELLHLWKGSSQPCKAFENLEYLNVVGCHKLKVLVPSSVSLQNLRILKVEKCNGLINLVTFSTAKRLKQLKIMEISECKMLEAIIMDTEGEIKDGIVFNKLSYLKLCRLPRLTNFTTGNFTIEFPYLQRVLLIECFKMMNFSQGVLSSPMLQRLILKEDKNEWAWHFPEHRIHFKLEEDGGCWEGDLNTTIQKLFKDMNGESSERN